MYNIHTLYTYNIHTLYIRTIYVLYIRAIYIHSIYVQYTYTIYMNNMHTIYITIYIHYIYVRASPVAQWAKDLPERQALQEPGLIPVSGRSPGGGQGNPLQCSCLEKPTGRGAWRAAARGVTECRTRLSDSQIMPSEHGWLLYWPERLPFLSVPHVQ